MSTSSAAEPLFHGARPMKTTPAAAASRRPDVSLAAGQLPMAATPTADIAEEAARAIRGGLAAGAASQSADQTAESAVDGAAPARRLARAATAGDGRTGQHGRRSADASRATSPATTEAVRTPVETAQPMTLPRGGRGREVCTPQDRTRDDGQWDPTPQGPASARRTARRQLPPPAQVAKEIALALFEVEAGYRSAAQLERVCTPELWDRLERQVRRHGGPPPSGRKLIRVHYQELTPGVANTVAVVERGPRVQPVAMRLDARNGRWLVTELRY